MKNDLPKSVGRFRNFPYRITDLPEISGPDLDIVNGEDDKGDVPRTWT